MIAHLSGRLIERRPEQVIVRDGGVGYRLFVSLNTFYHLPEIDSQVELHVHTVVRDDAIHLYGFGQRDEKEAFGHLIGVSGVGPRLALAILSGITAEELWLAVRARDTKRLVKIPGIGQKTAARLVVDLEGRLPAEAGDAAPLPAMSQAAGDAVSALMNLGYPEATAKKAVEKAMASLEEEPELEGLLRAVLKVLA